MSRFGTYLGSRVTVRYNRNKLFYYAQFLFIYFERTVVQIKKIHLDAKILIINTNPIIILCIKSVLFSL